MDSTPHKMKTLLHYYNLFHHLLDYIGGVLVVNKDINKC